jgi:endonuclease YncB( thermonuclease family)
MKLKYICIIIFLLFINSVNAQLKGKVIAVKDGDTIVVLDDSNTQHTIRIADIDCPEKSQAFGKKAKWFVSDAIFSSLVEIKIKGKDRYGRTIGYVFYKDKNLSEELLKNGLAWHYIKYSDSPNFQELENIARKNKIGLWNLTDPIAPWNYRKNKYK